ncbi:hypothetical protein M0R45_014125 [Rubus argutus]|uniref:Copine C-terminal domain-containing protein n=1 Tax=Rubus argutus TaxID=59490 RepID=A0AAW1XLB9_RUBAR
MGIHSRVNKNSPKGPSMAASSSTSSTRNTSPGRKDKQQNNSTDNSTATIYKTLDEVTAGLGAAGLESSGLITGIDLANYSYLKEASSNNNIPQSSSGQERAKLEFLLDSMRLTKKLMIMIDLMFDLMVLTAISKSLEPLRSDEDNSVPFFADFFEYGSQPASYATAIDLAVEIVERKGGRFQTLVLTADNQAVKNFFKGKDGELSPEGEKTIQSIFNASLYPLSIILVGVGNGSWEHMKNFQDKIPARKFDNFQFVNFTEIMSGDSPPSEKEATFAFEALKKTPTQYKAAVELGLIGGVTGKSKKNVPHPPSVPPSCSPVPNCGPTTSAPVIKA